MPLFGGRGRGKGTADSDKDEKKKNEPKACDRCFPSKASSPIVVKITRPRNNVNANRISGGSRLPSNRADCCKWCKNKENVNQMVFNQNKIINFDRINQINDFNSSAASPNVAAPNQPNANLEKKKCDNCIRILREKELELLKKEQEILKIKTHFTTLPKTGQQDGLGTNCEHCFKALREKEFELFRKEQEIAKMKMAAIKNPIDTQAKVDKAKCANCFKVLRKKELELLKKEHALMKNMTRPNINVKNLNYCSCCRDNNKAANKKMKKAEEIRKRNRDNCFKAIRMKEIQLLQKEREIDMKIQKFREESIAKAKRDLDKVPDPKLVVPKGVGDIKCVCSCSGPNYESDENKKRKGLCKLIHKKLPPALGGTRGTGISRADPIQTQVTILKNKAGGNVYSFTKPGKPTCKSRCCAVKLATNLTTYLLRPPGSKKPQKLPASCSFMRLVSWCSPGHLHQKNAIQKCCTMITSDAQKKEQLKDDKVLIEQQAKAVKTAQADSKAIAKSHEYRVETLGKIRPGKRKSKPTDKLDVVEAEVFRTYGSKGLETYKTKMAAISPPPIKQSRMGKIYKTLKIPESRQKGVSSEHKVTEYTSGTLKESTGTGFGTETPKAKSIVRVSGFQGGDTKQARDTVFPKLSKSTSSKTMTISRIKVGDVPSEKAQEFTVRKKEVSEKKETKKKEIKQKEIKQKEIKQKEIKKKEIKKAEVKKEEIKKKKTELDPVGTKSPIKYATEKYKDDYEPPKMKRSREVDYDDGPVIRRGGESRSYRSKSYDDDINWGMGPTPVAQIRRSYVPWRPEPPPCPMFVKVLGRSLIYCAGCFIGVPCIIFLCLCLLCNSD